jgi:hypothetical protein
MSAAHLRSMLIFAKRYGLFPRSLFAVLAFGAIFGTMGVLLATPLAVVAYVAVTDLYVRDALGEDVHVPESPQEQPASAS